MELHSSQLGRFRTYIKHRLYLGVAIRTTFNIAGIIYYTCNFVFDIQCNRYKNVFNEMCVKTTLLRSIPNKGILSVMHQFDTYSSTSYSRRI